MKKVKKFTTLSAEEYSFNVVNKFIQRNKTDWNRYVEISTEELKSMVGINKGLFARIQNVI